MTLQFDTYLPLAVSERTIEEELGATVFVEFDCNDKPFVSEIWLENKAPGGKSDLKLSDKSTGDDAVFWRLLKDEAFEAVRGDVQDAVMEDAA